MFEIELEQIQETLQQHGYEYKQLLGQGSFASVLLCHSNKYKQDFAIKRAIKHKISVYEYNTLVSLHHPNIIKLYDAFEDEDTHFLVMDYCPNGTVRQRIGLPYDRFIYYAKQMIEALAYCHANNIAHRDIKPDNIFIDQYDHIKLADFGLARQFDEESKSNEKCGSLIFVPPEMFQCNEVCPFKADIWALGITFFFMATGNYPFRGKSREELKQNIIRGELDYVRYKVDPKIRFLISKMTVKDPNSRYTAEKLLKLPMFSPALSKKPFFLTDASRKQSFTTGCLVQANAGINKSMTFDEKQMDPQTPNNNNKTKLPLLDILSYRSINVKPNIQRMSSRQSIKPI